MPIETDLDLPPLRRTLAMFWQLEYRKAKAELIKSNRVIERLSRRVKRLRNVLKENEK